MLYEQRVYMYVVYMYNVHVYTCFVHVYTCMYMCMKLAERHTCIYIMCIIICMIGHFDSYIVTVHMHGYRGHSWNAGFISHSRILTALVYCCQTLQPIYNVHV